MADVLKRLSLGSVYWLGRFKPVREMLKPRRGIGALLMYHQVLPDNKVSDHKHGDNPNIISVSRFEEQMKYLAENYRPMAMDDLPAHMEHPEDFSVAVTFDDGYKDNKIHALPILEKYRIPAVIYVVTQFATNGEGMWWLELGDLAADSDQLRFKTQGKETVLDTSTPQGRREAIQQVAPLLMDAGPREQKELLEGLRGGRPAVVYPDIMMNWDEIREISENPLITIGCHTHTHMNVARLTEDQFRDEIETSKTMLEKQIQKKVNHFAFPYGSPKSPTEREFRILAPFLTAATTRSLLLKTTHKRHALPRMQVTQSDDATRLNIRLSGLEDIIRQFYYKVRKK